PGGTRAVSRCLGPFTVYFNARSGTHWQMLQRPEEPRPRNVVGGSAVLADHLFLQAGRLADTVAQVVKLGAAHHTVARDLDLVDLGTVDEVGLLNAHAGSDLAHGDFLHRALSMHRKHGALEDLDALHVLL